MIRMIKKAFTERSQHNNVMAMLQTSFCKQMGRKMIVDFFGSCNRKQICNSLGKQLKIGRFQNIYIYISENYAVVQHI